MATITLTLTKDHLKMIPFFFIQENDNENGIEIQSTHMYNLGSHLLEDMAHVLGKMDKMIPQTKNDPDGAAFDDETEAYLLDIHKYITDNLYYIETLIHQFVMQGLTEGTYKAKSNELIWEKI